MSKVKPDQVGDKLARITDKFGELTEKKVNKGVRIALFNTWTPIIKETPVDTGRARAAWFVTKGVPSNRDFAGLLPDNVARKTSGLNIFKNVNWYLTNNLPYIYTLEFGGYPKNPKTPSRNRQGKIVPQKTEDGWSTQLEKGAPRGMMRRNVLKWSRNLKAAFKALG